MKEFNADFHRKRVFANKLNGINLKELNQKEREELFIKEKIYIKSNRNPPEKYLKKCIENNTLFKAICDVNPKLYEEIILDFHNQHDYVCTDIFAYTKRLNNKLDCALHKDHKRKIVEKAYKKVLRKINKLETYFWYRLDNEELIEYGYENFDTYIYHEITDEFLYKYITSEFASYYHHRVFKDLLDIVELEYKLKYCKEELIKLENGLSGKKEKELSKYPNIFPNREYELFFYKFLKTYNCIDENNKPISGRFQTHCDAYFETIKKSEHKKGSSLLIRGRIKNKFIKMLNIEFKQKIEKLSDGSKRTDVAESFIENLFENKKN